MVYLQWRNMLKFSRAKPNYDRRYNDVCCYNYKG